MQARNDDRGTELAGRVEKARTFWTRLKGLRGRQELPDGEALWIVPSRGVHTRGMSFAIDVVFLDGAMRVVAVEEEMAPGRIAPMRWRARTVLELPAGTIKKTGTRVGDRIVIETEQGG